MFLYLCLCAINPVKLAVGVLSAVLLLGVPALCVFYRLRKQTRRKTTVLPMDTIYDDDVKAGDNGSPLHSHSNTGPTGECGETKPHEFHGHSETPLDSHAR
ncbi:hypothetical protein GN956_G26640 [Arapaima gigas]